MEPNPAPADFYVENSCCTSCGVSIAAAPDLIGWTDARELHCYWKKQPETAYELNQAFKIFEGQPPLRW